MAVNRIRGAFAVPRKGETFELRAGLVWVPSRIRVRLGRVLQLTLEGRIRSQYAYERYTDLSARYPTELMMGQERSNSEDDHVHDTGEGRLGTLSRRTQEHCNRRPGSKEARLPVLNVRSCGLQRKLQQLAEFRIGITPSLIRISVSWL